MYEKNAVVELAQGLHARPASEFVQRARAFSSKISLIKGDKAVDAKSILGLMGLAVARGTEVTIRAEGTDETAAVDALCEYLSQAE